MVSHKISWFLYLTMTPAPLYNTYTAICILMIPLPLKVSHILYKDIFLWLAEILTSQMFKNHIYELYGSNFHIFVSKSLPNMCFNVLHEERVL